MILWGYWGFHLQDTFAFANVSFVVSGVPLAGYFHFRESILCGYCISTCRMLSLLRKYPLWLLGFHLQDAFTFAKVSFVRRNGLVHAQDAFAFAKDPLCEEVLYPTISGTGKGACPFGFVRRSLKEKASFLFQTPSNKTVLRLCRRTPEIVVTRTGFKPVTF